MDSHTPASSARDLPLRRSPPPHLDEAELRRRFDIERRLADRLRSAGPEARQALYSQVYDDYHAAVAQGQGQDEPAPDPTVAELQQRLLSPFLGSARRFLEIGAGDAELARRLSNDGLEVTVVEASRESLPSTFSATSRAAAVKSNEGAGTLRWVNAGTAHCQLEPSSFDLAFSSHFVEHLHPDDLDRHLRDVLHWTRPGGHYVVVTPNRLCGPHDVSGYFSREPLGFHLREYSHGELAAALRAAGWVGLSALSGVGRSPRRRSLILVRLAEAVLDPVGWAARERLYQGRRWRARQPFRPLEQVVIVGQRPD